MGWLDFWNWQNSPYLFAPRSKSIIVHDEILPLALAPENYVSAGIKFCTSPGGRYGFILGTTMYRKRTTKTEFLSTLRMDIVDFWTDKRHKTTIHDLTRCGNYFVHFYALDENTLVLVDHNHSLAVLTQRLVIINHATRRIEVPFERRYSLITSPFSMIKLSIGKKMCAVLAMQPLFEEWQVLLIPKVPLHFIPNTMIDPTVTMNRTLIPALHATTSCAEIAYRLCPFFTEYDTNLNFFVTNLDTRCLDNNLRIATMDLMTGECIIKESTADPDTLFPFSSTTEHETPIVVDCAAKQHGATNVLLAARYRPVQGAIRDFANNVIMCTTNTLLNVLFRWVGIDTKILGDLFINTITMMVRLRSKIMLPIKVRLGMLNVETLQWQYLTENDADFNSMHATLTEDDQKMIVLHREFNQDAKTTRHRIEFNIVPSPKCNLKTFVLKAILSKRDTNTANFLMQMYGHTEYMY